MSLLPIIFKVFIVPHFSPFLLQFLNFLHFYFSHSEPFVVPERTMFYILFLYLLSHCQKCSLYPCCSSSSLTWLWFTSRIRYYIIQENISDALILAYMHLLCIPISVAKPQLILHWKYLWIWPELSTEKEKFIYIHTCLCRRKKKEGKGKEGIDKKWGRDGVLREIKTALFSSQGCYKDQTRQYLWKHYKNYMYQDIKWDLSYSLGIWKFLLRL